MMKLHFRLTDEQEPEYFFENQELQITASRSRPILEVAKYDAEWKLDTLLKLDNWEGKSSIYCELMWGDRQPNYSITHLAVIGHYGNVQPRDASYYREEYSRGMFQCWQDKQGNLVSDPRPRFPSHRGIPWIKRHFPNLQVLRIRAVSCRFWPHKFPGCPNKFAMKRYPYPQLDTLLKEFPNLQKLELEVLRNIGNKEEFEKKLNEEANEVPRKTILDRKDGQFEFNLASAIRIRKRKADESIGDLWEQNHISVMEILTPKAMESWIQPFYVFLMGTKSPDSIIKALPKDIVKYIFELYCESLLVENGYRPFGDWTSVEDSDHSFGEEYEVRQMESNGKIYSVYFSPEEPVKKKTIKLHLTPAESVKKND